MVVTVVVVIIAIIASSKVNVVLLVSLCDEQEQRAWAGLKRVFFPTLSNLVASERVNEVNARVNANPQHPTANKRRDGELQLS